MNTILIIGAVLVGALALAFGAVRLARRSGQELQKSEDARLSAEHEAKVQKAIADALAQPTTTGDVIRDLEEGDF